MTSNNDPVEFIGQRLSVFIGKLEEFLRKTCAHVHPNHDARSSVATFGEISVNLHAPLANFNGARPIGPSNIPLRGENLIITRRMLIVWSNRNWNNLEIIRELNSLYRGIRLGFEFDRGWQNERVIILCANEFAQQSEKTFVIIYIVYKFLLVDLLGD